MKQQRPRSEGQWRAPVLCIVADLLASCVGVGPPLACSPAASPKSSFSFLASWARWVCSTLERDEPFLQVIHISSLETLEDRCGVYFLLVASSLSFGVPFCPHIFPFHTRLWALLTCWHFRPIIRCTSTFH